MAQFEATRRTLPGLDIYRTACESRLSRSRDRYTGAAWLSSARAVRCSVKSGNERNPRRQLPSGKAGDSGGTARVKREEGADDVKSVWPLRPGLHTCYNGRHRRKRCCEAERILKTGLSSDRSLQPDSVKPESVVKADQPRRLEYVPGPCTHRPSHHGSRMHPKSPRNSGAEGVSGDRDEVVTR